MKLFGRRKARGESSGLELRRNYGGGAMKLALFGGGGGSRGRKPQRGRRHGPSTIQRSQSPSRGRSQSPASRRRSQSPASRLYTRPQAPLSSKHIPSSRLLDLLPSSTGSDRDFEEDDQVSFGSEMLNKANPYSVPRPLMQRRRSNFSRSRSRVGRGKGDEQSLGCPIPSYQDQQNHHAVQYHDSRDDYGLRSQESLEEDEELYKESQPNGHRRLQYEADGEDSRDRVRTLRPIRIVEREYHGDMDIDEREGAPPVVDCEAWSATSSLSESMSGRFVQDDEQRLSRAKEAVQARQLQAASAPLTKQRPQYQSPQRSPHSESTHPVQNMVSGRTMASSLHRSRHRRAKVSSKNAPRAQRLDFTGQVKHISAIDEATPEDDSIQGDKSECSSKSSSRREKIFGKKKKRTGDVSLVKSRIKDIEKRELENLARAYSDKEQDMMPLPRQYTHQEDPPLEMKRSLLKQSISDQSSTCSSRYEADDERTPPPHKRDSVSMLSSSSSNGTSSKSSASDPSSTKMSNTSQSSTGQDATIQERLLGMMPYKEPDPPDDGSGIPGQQYPSPTTASSTSIFNDRVDLSSVNSFIGAMDSFSSLASSQISKLIKAVGPKKAEPAGKVPLVSGSFEFESQLRAISKKEHSVVVETVPSESSSTWNDVALQTYGQFSPFPDIGAPMDGRAGSVSSSLISQRSLGSAEPIHSKLQTAPEALIAEAQDGAAGSVLSQKSSGGDSNSSVGLNSISSKKSMGSKGSKSSRFSKLFARVTKDATSDKSSLSKSSSTSRTLTKSLKALTSLTPDDNVDEASAKSQSTKGSKRSKASTSSNTGSLHLVLSSNSGKRTDGNGPNIPLVPMDDTEIIAGHAFVGSQSSHENAQPKRSLPSKLPLPPALPSALKKDPKSTFPPSIQNVKSDSCGLKIKETLSLLDEAESCASSHKDVLQWGFQIMAPPLPKRSFWGHGSKIDANEKMDKLRKSPELVAMGEIQDKGEEEQNISVKEENANSSGTVSGQIGATRTEALKTEESNPPPKQRKVKFKDKTSDIPHDYSLGDAASIVADDESFESNSVVNDISLKNDIPWKVKGNSKIKPKPSPLFFEVLAKDESSIAAHSRKSKSSDMGYTTDDSFSRFTDDSSSQMSNMTMDSAYAKYSLHKAAENCLEWPVGSLGNIDSNVLATQWKEYHMTQPQQGQQAKREPQQQLKPQPTRKNSTPVGDRIAMMGITPSRSRENAHAHGKVMSKGLAQLDSAEWSVNDLMESMTKAIGF